MKANILINKDRRACIADFSLTTVTGVGTHTFPGSSPVSTFSEDTLMSFTCGGTRRWMSPELLAPEQFGIPQLEGDRPTRQSDCYALGMAIYEVSVTCPMLMNSLLLTADRHCPRSCVDTIHSLSFKTILRLLRSSTASDRKNLWGQRVLDSTMNYGRWLNGAGGRIALNAPT